MLVDMVSENEVEFFRKNFPRLPRHFQTMIFRREGGQGLVNLQTETLPSTFLKPVQSPPNPATVVQNASLGSPMNFYPTKVQPRNKALKLRPTIIPPALMNFYRFPLGSVQGSLVEGFQTNVRRPSLLEEGSALVTKSPLGRQLVFPPLPKLRGVPGINRGRRSFF